MDIIRRYVEQFNAADEEIYHNAVDNAHAADEIPVFECPDADIERTYYFRWWTYRKHVKRTEEDGWVITEFLPKVPWSGKHNTINAAVGHHIYEGRWLKNGREYLTDYIRCFCTIMRRGRRRISSRTACSGRWTDGTPWNTPSAARPREAQSPVPAHVPRLTPTCVRTLSPLRNSRACTAMRRQRRSISKSTSG